jgi:hypothetical protein
MEYTNVKELVELKLKVQREIEVTGKPISANILDIENEIGHLRFDEAYEFEIEFAKNVQLPSLN